MKKYLLVPAVLLAMVIGVSVCAGAAQGPEEAAVSAAQKWLGLVDGGKFGESWDEASQVFRAATSKDQWKKSLEAVRTPLGKMTARKVKSKQYTKTLPGAPDGEYVVIQFETSFQNKAAGIETVTPMREKDGSWKVSGYYIR